MSRLRRPERAERREGYVALLALSFAFGLAVFGGALATGVQNYLRTVGIEQRRVLDRMSLESAAVRTLGDIASGESLPLRPHRRSDIEINGRRISVIISLPEGKLEPATDDRKAIREIFSRAGVSPRGVGFGGDGLAAFLTSHHVTAAQEDCLRRDLTHGRAPEDFRPEAAIPDRTGQAEEDGAERVVSTGDQVDLRLASASPEGERVLWMRVRFMGDGRGWALHDYRALTVRQPGCGPWP